MWYYDKTNSIRNKILIESQWNLNYDVWIEKGLVTVILIESQWNLNK